MTDEMDPVRQAIAKIFDSILKLGEVRGRAGVDDDISPELNRHADEFTNEICQLIEFAARKGIDLGLEVANSTPREAQTVRTDTAPAPTSGQLSDSVYAAQIALDAMARIDSVRRDVRELGRRQEEETETKSTAKKATKVTFEYGWGDRIVSGTTSDGRKIVVDYDPSTGKVVGAHQA